MILGTAALLALAWSAAPEPARVPVRIAQLTIRQQIIIRRPHNADKTGPANAPNISWRESRGPRCVSASQIVGATLLGQDSVDLILRDNRRLRARLEQRCPALDYYYGFYVSVTSDGRICAERDSIRSRVGGQCMIDAFRTLTPVAAR